MSPLALLLLTVAAAGGDEAQESWNGRLRAIPAVSGDVFSKQGRFEITPTASFSIGDAFYRKSVFGLNVGFHVAETFALAGYAGYSLSSAARSMQICDGPTAADACAYPTEAELEGRASGQ